MVSEGGGGGGSLHPGLLFLSILQPRPFAGPCEFNSCIWSLMLNPLQDSGEPAMNSSHS